MKKWIAVLMVASMVMCPLLARAGILSGSTIIEEWSFTGDSQVGVNGNTFPGDTQWLDIPGNDTLTIASANDQYTTKDLTITPGTDEIYISWTIDDWALTNYTAGTSVFFGLKGGDTIGVELSIDSPTNSWAAIRAGNAKVVKARLAKTSAEGTGPYIITARMDFDAGEVQLFVSNDGAWDNWSGVQWAAPDTIAADYTVSFDFSTVLDGSSQFTKTRMAYAGGVDGEHVTVDNVSIETPADLVAPEGVYIDDSASLNANNVAMTNTFANLTVTNGDYVVVEAAVNNTTWDVDEITFGGSASLGSVVYDSLVGSGPKCSLWYAPVTSTGTVDVTLTMTDADGTIAYGSVQSYVVRSSSGSLDILAQPSVGSVTNVLTDIVYTNVYDFGTSSTGLLIEAASTYMTSITSGNPDYTVDYPNAKRLVGHADFSGVSSVTNIWTGVLPAKQAVVLGIAFAASAPTTPTSQYEDFLADGTDVGSATGLQDHGDSDGLDNLTEYAFGGDAGDPAEQGNVPVESQVSEGGTNYIQYVYFERGDAAARGLVSILKVGTDLVFTDWTNGVEFIEFVGSGAGPEGYTAVTNRISTDDDDKRFLRLQIEFTP